MPILYQDQIKRDDLRAHPDRIYLFGDNVARQGRGGQAREMRGEPNALGIATKWCPGNAPKDFFYDHEKYQHSGDLRARVAVAFDLFPVLEALEAGRTVVIPSAGIGTGLARLPEKAPPLYAFLDTFLQGLAAKYGVIQDQQNTAKP